MVKGNETSLNEIKWKTRQRFTFVSEWTWGRSLEPIG